MATVELRFSALPAHVRTARLVAASVARRSGVDDALLDEVRLAVGEACSRAVGLHRRAGMADPVTVRLREEPGRFSVEVQDCVPSYELAVVPTAAGAGGLPGPARGAVMNGVADPGDPASAMLDADPDMLDGVLGLAVISGLVDDVEVRAEPGGAVVRMSWPAGGPNAPGR
jgi:anti-sigma regulatory factor (Ser/Thr protein kinase)